MKRTVLVVEDNAVNRELLGAILRREYNVLEAEGGEQACALLEREYASVSAVVLDLVMPEMDGYEVIRKIRGNPLVAQIPIIVATGSSDVDSESRALALGANDYVVKPYDAEIILHRIRNTIKLRESAAIINALKTDFLTGLYTRQGFFDIVRELVARKPAGYYVMACFDIDGFKVINDQYGARKGDEVLRFVADVFKRNFEPEGGVCARIVSDTFALLYPITLIGGRTLERARNEAAQLDGSILPISYRIGRYVVDDTDMAASAMLDRATIAAHSVKGRYDNRVAMYDESMRLSILRTQEIISEMKGALESGQFEVWFQPQYNHSSGALVGAEALVRWRHPVKGIIPPGEFIPLFEKNGFVYELDKFVWEQSCQCLRRWLDEGTALSVSVNISRSDLFRDDLVAVITGLVERYGVPKELLYLEITESAFADSSQQIIDVVKKLIDYGFTVEIDDFGSGYSSLNTLKDVPAQVLKLDMRFLESTKNSDRGGNILESIVRMAKWINMSVIAEGVENAEDADFLRSIGCAQIQGFLYARPMPAGEYEALMRTSAVDRTRLKLETVENLDNNRFWDPKSMDTLVFNSYVGGACIYEYHDGTTDLLRVNERFVQIMGGKLTADDLLRTRAEDYMDARSVQAKYDAIKRAIATKAEASYEVRLTGLVRADESRYYRGTLRAIARAGERVLIYCSLIDVTELREAQSSAAAAAERFQIIMDGVGCGITAAVPTGAGKYRIIHSNNRFYELMGYTRDEYSALFPDGIGPVLGDDRAVLLEACDGVAATGEKAVVDYRVRHRDGQIIWLRHTLTRTELFGVSGHVQLGIYTDVTGEKLAEARIAKSTRQLHFLNDTAHGLLARADSEQGIDTVLRQVLDYFKGNRAYIVEIDDARGVTNNTYEVCAPGVDSQMELLQGVPVSDAAFWFTRLERGYIDIPDVDALDDSRAAERELLRQQDIRSLVACPLTRDGALIGFVGVDDPSENNGDIPNLQAIGDYLCVILTRRDLTARLEEAAREAQELMNNTPGGFARMRVFPDGHVSTVFVNDSFLAHLGMGRQEYFSLYAEDSLSGVHPDDIENVTASIGRVVKNGSVGNVKYRLRAGNGDYIWFIVYGRCVENPNGEVYLNAYFADPSESEKQELNIQRTLPFVLNAIMESATDLAFAKDSEFRYLCCTRSFAQMAGLENERDVVGKTDYELFDKAIADGYRADDERLFADGKPLTDILDTLPSADGSPRYSNTSKFILRDTAGNIIGLYGVGRDITDYRATYDRLKLLTDTINGGIATYRITPGRIELTYFNDGYCRLVESPREEYAYSAAKNPMGLVHPDDAHLITEGVARALATGEPQECVYRMALPGGKIKWIKLSGSVSERVGDAAMFSTVLIDITDSVVAERMATSSSEQMNAIIRNINGGVSAFTYSGGKAEYLFVNDAYYALLGYTRRQYEKERVEGLFGRILPEDLDSVIAANRRAAEKEESATAEYRVTKRDGSVIWVRTSSSVCHMPNVDAPVHVAVTYDITAEREREESLRMSAERFRSAVALGGRAMALYDIKNDVYSDETGFLERHGLPNKLHGLPDALIADDVIAKWSVDDVRDQFARIRGGARDCGADLALRSPEGEYRWYHSEASVITDEQGAPSQAIIVFHDVTEQREKEAVFKKYQQSFTEKALEDYTLFRCNLSRDASFDSMQGGLLRVEFKRDSLTFNERTLEYANPFVHPDDRAEYVALINSDTLLANYYRGKRMHTLEYRELLERGEFRWIRVTVELVEYPNTSEIEAYLLYEDIDAQKRDELATRELAEKDPLTGILNRATFASKLEEIIRESKSTDCHALLMLDLDGFKQVNDAFGHGAGDRALIEIADSLHGALRQGDLLGRLGGDEFLIFLRGIHSDDAARKKAMQVCALTRKSFGVDIKISASIGIALYPRDGADFETLYRNGDAALYFVKDSGKDSYTFYSKDMKTESFEPQTAPDPDLSPRRLKRRLLIADDSDADLAIMSNIFKDEFLIETAASGGAALKTLRHFGSAVSAVLLDLRMPDMDGFAVLEAMSANKALSSIPVIVVTASNDEQTSLKAIKHGAADFATKPIDSELLRRRVYSAISKAENGRLLAQNRQLLAQEDELGGYRAVFELSGSAMAEYNCRTRAFRYDDSLARVLAGSYDSRELWTVLADDGAASAATAERIRLAVEDAAADADGTLRSLAAMLKTAEGKRRLFSIKIVKFTHKKSFASKLLIVFTLAGARRL